MRESILKTVFFKSSQQISTLKWLKLLFLEAYLGEQLIEMLANTASFNKDQSGDLAFDIKPNGWKVNLEEYIPATIINSLLNKHIIDLLETKFVNHYQLIQPVKMSSNNVKKLYELNNQKLFLLTELKLSYNTIWVTINLLIDTVVYIITKDVTWALVSGAIVEFIRRFKI
ncbi:hypothetical protein HLH17_15925 [Acinetobacter sp. ANC 5380]|uniref:Uncharacterized protein n=1 Tax=Acinetobacter terrae TaxID=2731247 RepID=A0A7Y2RIJ4_9GAMM|nr:hypothetical protein [Acinetobacter terrae]NNH79106.1 hypothetical protein [Acinetobacter terrae]